MKIVYTILASFNRFIEKMPVRQKQTIRQLFGMIIFVSVIAAVVAGISMGKKAADKGGVPLVNTTRDVFEIDISRDKERASFADMIESDQLIEKDTESNKVRVFPESGDTPLTSHKDIIEKDEPKIAEPSPFISEKLPTPISDTDTRTEEKISPDISSETSTGSKEVIMPESHEIMSSDSPGASAPAKADDSSEELWSPTGEKSEEPSAVTPLSRDEEIFE
ncbi:MAG: hypothetical protein JXK07_08880 [Spirochaetes bacterium]|nr:hypothetical protein [Spirochaetota bacterium]MBN2770605.1 hypothetical protein [Spirochaetota bacterium]